MVARFDINFWESGGTLMLVKKIIYLWKEILIIDDNLIQLEVVFTHPKGTIFIPYK